MPPRLKRHVTLRIGIRADSPGEYAEPQVNRPNCSDVTIYEVGKPLAVPVRWQAVRGRLVGVWSDDQDGTTLHVGRDVGCTTWTLLLSSAIIGEPL